MRALRVTIQLRRGPNECLEWWGEVPEGGGEVEMPPNMWLSWLNQMQRGGIEKLVVIVNPAAKAD